ncbi:MULTISPECIES: hypothetical protein [Okeania]|uniref:hypothetical protein n=1 Tax=Okeania TaxID=1458928 RepID=UPI000F543738|nr:MULTISPECIES: hypothetical protein [Okeania]NES76433.1 hypothetical protein [Okeania sp. SIO1H4]NES88129.1 hypothetical protein [Okeania sp. SIO2B9]NET21786.1 hypothetical protein [Okeania sp. SIO1H5]NET78761.1 hypothetical protein [Okeania sp. SIO1F9]NET97198.1 hypothetical protein [Okeania sp. SIO1H2]
MMNRKMPEMLFPLLPVVCCLLPVPHYIIEKLSLYSIRIISYRMIQGDRVSRTESGESQDESGNYLWIFRHFMSALNGSRECNNCITGFYIKALASQGVDFFKRSLLTRCQLKVFSY